MKDKNRIAQVKTFVYPLENYNTDLIDKEVNTFCIEHGASSVIFDTLGRNIIYRVFYCI